MLHWPPPPLLKNGYLNYVEMYEWTHTLIILPITIPNNQNNNNNTKPTMHISIHSTILKPTHMESENATTKKILA